MSHKNKTRKPQTHKKTVTRTNNKPNWILYALIGIAIVIVVGIFLWNNKPSGSTIIPSQISIQEAYEKYQAGVFFLDVRTQEEWEAFHAPNSTLIPLDQLPNRLNELPRDQEIVVVCRSGNRSQSGRDIVLNAGFANVTSMTGGLNAWKAAGYPTVSGK